MMDRIWSWLLGKFRDYITRNWRTVVVGFVGAIASRYVSDQNTRDAILAATMAALSVVAGDAKSEPLATSKAPLLAAVPKPPDVPPDVPPSAWSGP